MFVPPADQTSQAARTCAQIIATSVWQSQSRPQGLPRCPSGALASHAEDPGDEVVAISYPEPSQTSYTKMTRKKSPKRRSVRKKTQSARTKEIISEGDVDFRYYFNQRMSGLTIFLNKVIQYVLIIHH